MESFQGNYEVSMQFVECHSDKAWVFFHFHNSPQNAVDNVLKILLIQASTRNKIFLAFGELMSAKFNPAPSIVLVNIVFFLIPRIHVHNIR